MRGLSGRARPRFVLAPLNTGRCWLVNVPSPESVPEPALVIGAEKSPDLPWRAGNVSTLGGSPPPTTPEIGECCEGRAPEWRDMPRHGRDLAVENARSARVASSTARPSCATLRSERFVRHWAQ